MGDWIVGGRARACHQHRDDHESKKSPARALASAHAHFASEADPKGTKGPPRVVRRPTAHKMAVVITAPRIAVSDCLVITSAKSQVPTLSTSVDPVGLGGERRPSPQRVITVGSRFALTSSRFRLTTGNRIRAWTCRRLAKQPDQCNERGTTSPLSIRPHSIDDRPRFPESGRGLTSRTVCPTARSFSWSGTDPCLSSRIALPLEG